MRGLYKVNTGRNIGQLTEKQSYAQERLNKAALTLHRLPNDRIQSYPNFWPQICHDPLEIAQMEAKLRIRPSAQDISQMEEVLFVWLPKLEPFERKLVWKRAERVNWKRICVEFGVGRTKAWEMYRCALGKIAVHL